MSSIKVATSCGGGMKSRRMLDTSQTVDEALLGKHKRKIEAAGSMGVCLRKARR